MIKVAAYAVLTLSAIGFGVSLVSHVCALAGVDVPLGDLTWGLHIGIFVVWFPAVLFSRRLVENLPRRDFWKAALRGCPEWMRYAVYVLFGYTFLNFIVFMFVKQPPAHSSGGPMPPSVVRGFSGHWMLFYGAAFVIAYSYIRVGSRPLPGCPNGHEVDPLAKFCGQCGSPLTDARLFDDTPVWRA